MWTRQRELNNEFKNIKEQKEKDKKIYKTIIKTDPQKWKKKLGGLPLMKYCCPPWLADEKKFSIENCLQRLEKLNICRRQVM